MNKLPISAFVVSKNEGHLLENCIKSILFCDEIIVVNLESTDNTVAIAEKYGSKVITIPPIPIIEIIHHKYINVTKNDWVIITDPDEVASSELVHELQHYFLSILQTSTIGAVDVPIVYFFKNHQLKGTSWGGIKTRTYLIHKDRFIFLSNVHNGRFLLPGFEKHTILSTGKNQISHFWMLGYRQIFEKHLRYLKNEGKSRFDGGRVTSIKQIIATPFRQFRNSFFYAKGYKDGFVGLFLSIFRSWYFTAANIELYKYQRKQPKKL
jgi:glycosyltransferase involved in cell wall biosynthesis